MKDMSEKNPPGVLLGALVGFMITLPVLSLAYTGWKVAMLPFAPYILFDFMSRVLPGWMITEGIDFMVMLIRKLNLPETSEAAKAVEQVIGVLIFLLTCIVITSVFFISVRFSKRRFVFLSGIASGCIVGLSVSIAALVLTREFYYSFAVTAIWNIGLFLIWGGLLSLVYLRLVFKPVFASIKTQREDVEIERVDRRRFIIKLGGAAAFVTVTGAVISETFNSRQKSDEILSGDLWSSNNLLPNSDASLKPAPGTRPELTPLKDHYRIDINTTVPVVNKDSWRLKVYGMVNKPREFTLDELTAYNPLHQFITLSCISNPVGGDLIGTTRWTGVSMQKLLPDLKLNPNASHLKIRSVDGFYESVSIEEIRSDERIMLTYGWDGIPLTAEHGYPLRIYIPNVYGMKQPKWIESIEAIDHWEPGYWVTRGWDKHAVMKATSVIDTVAMGKMVSKPDGRPLVPIGGIAHAGSRGISKVEIQVDEEDWQEAEIRTPLSETTWVIWRFDWPLEKGRHFFTVRCTDSNGNTQISEESPPHPSGATGYYSKELKL